MQNFKSKNSLVISIIILIVAAVGLYFMSRGGSQKMATNPTSGLQITVLTQGSGAEIKNGQMASVNYTGTFTDGKKFDSNVDPAFKHVQPFQFTVGGRQVIAGWDQGVLGMKVGEKRKLVISPELGYGANPVGPIPANSTLIFEVELLAIK